MGPLGGDDHRGGTRLCATFEATSADARQFVAFRDLELGVDCRMFETSPTTARCLPGTGEIEYYLDAGCSLPIHVESTSPCVPTARFASRRTSTTCFAGEVEMFRVANQIAPATVYYRSGTACYVQCAPSSGGRRVRARVGWQP